jgi:hypothetical protein
VRLRLQSLIVGWPPQATLVLDPGDEKPLNELFVAIEDTRVLRHGYAPRSGIEDLSDLRSRVDDLRDPLRACLRDLGNAPVGEWIRKLQDACDELVSEISEILYEERQTERSDVEPAVEDLRQAFRLMALRLSDEYHLEAAESLAGRIQTQP